MLYSWQVRHYQGCTNSSRCNTYVCIYGRTDGRMYAKTVAWACLTGCSWQLGRYTWSPMLWKIY